MSFKLNLLTSAMLAAAASTAQADIVTFSGDTTGGSAFNRPIEERDTLSLIGTATRFSAFTFTVTLDGSYSFLSTAAFDSFVLLYESPFASSTPLQNVLAANDDLLASTTAGFQAELVAGTSYVFVTTGYGNDDYGAFTNTIGGRGLITAVPEVDTYLLLLCGLLAVAGIARRNAES